MAVPAECKKSVKVVTDPETKLFYFYFTIYILMKAHFFGQPLPPI